MQRKETFDAIARQYDRYRPAYPEDLFDDLLAYGGLARSASILEIGCGTGQATAGLVKRGYTNITCIELGENLARIAREKFKAYPRLVVINAAFEEWTPKAGFFDLAISATAFHFIEPSSGYKKVYRLLKPAGKVGFFWTIHVPLAGELGEKMRAIYKRRAPHLSDHKKPRPQEVINERRRLLAAGGLFEDLTVKEYQGVETYSCQDYLSLLNTHSQHQQLPADIRKRLFSDLEKLINAQGGLVQKPQMVALFLARKSAGNAPR